MGSPSFAQLLGGKRLVSGIKQECIDFMAYCERFNHRTCIVDLNNLNQIGAESGGGGAMFMADLPTL